MTLGTLHKPDEDIDNRYSPADDLSNTVSELNDYEKNASDQIKDSFNDTSSSSDINDAEKNISDKESSYNSSLYQSSNKKSGKSKSILKLAKNSRAMMAIIGILLSIAATFSVLLPLKLNSLLDNIDQQIGSVAQHSVEERLEYITTRWITQRIMGTAYPGDENIVFCKGGGIICSLTSTKYSAWFEKMLDAKFEKDGVNVRAVINANGRSGLGGKASSFTIRATSRDLSSIMKGVEKEVSHKEVRKIIKKQIARVHGRNYLMRFISKRILYNKYGVKSFNIIPEKTARKWADFKAKIKSDFNSRALAKISPKFASYLSCISGKDAIGCKETIEKIGNNLDSDLEERKRALEEKPDDPIAKRDYEAAKNNKENFSRVKFDINGDGTFGKIVNSSITKNIVAGGALIGGIDMVAKLVGAIDSGVLEMVGRAQVAQTYASFAYDEGISPVVVNDMMKAGDLKDIRYLELATSLFDGAESSPLYNEIQTGGITSSILPILSGNSVSASGGIRTKCVVDGEEKVVTLEPGELVCPEKKVVQDYTTFTKNPAWKAIAGVANFWNNYFIGMVIDKATDLASLILSPLTDFLSNLPGIKQIIGASEDIIKKVVELAIGYIFRIPDVGIDSPGNNNYEALVGAQMVTTADSLEQGRTSDGSGVGGKLLSDNELAAITTKINQEEKDHFEEQPILAKLFDYQLKNSVANQLLAIMPIGKKSTINFLTKTPALLLSPLLSNQRTFAATNRLSVMKSMGIPWYGYTDPEVLRADPNKYDAATCKAYEEARNNSFGRDRSTGYVVPVYREADPCALEEVVAGILAERSGDTDSKYYIEEVGARSGNSNSSISVGDAVGPPELEEAQTGWGGHSNGNIPDSEMQELSFSPGNKIHKKAAIAIEEMNKAYKAETGNNLTINEAYRDCDTQIAYATRGNPLYQGGAAAPAPPCISNHGWGLAVDINVGGISSAVYKWLEANAHKYGYVHPPWAKPDGNKPEPWHWEYARKVN